MHGKWRNQRHHPTLGSPGAPLATPFLLPPAHSSLHYSTRLLKALFAPSPSPPFPFIRPCFSHSVALYFAPCLDFMCTAKWSYFAAMCDKRARNGKTIVNFPPKLIHISSFDVFYSKKMHSSLAVIICGEIYKHFYRDAELLSKISDPIRPYAYRQRFSTFH